MKMVDYYCKKCGEELLDVLVRVESEEKKQLCHICSTPMEHKLGATGFKFKSAALQKHLRKYGSSNECVPRTPGNGVKFTPVPKGKK